MPVMHLLSRRRSVLDLFSKDPSPRTLDNASDSDLHIASPGLLSPTDPRFGPRPVSEHGYGQHSRLSQEVQPEEVLDAEPESSNKVSKRFSMMRLRNFSESQIGSRNKLDMTNAAEELPPVPTVTAEGILPAIVRTAPTTDMGDGQPVEEAETDVEVEPEETPRSTRPSLFKRASSRRRAAQQEKTRKSMDEPRKEKSKSSSLRWRRSRHDGLADLHRLSTMHINNNATSPPAYDDVGNNSLAIPIAQSPDSRPSDVSQSDLSHTSSHDSHIYGSTTTTTHTISTHTTFFRLPGRGKNRNSLFPLPVKVPPPDDPELQNQEAPKTPRARSSTSVPQTPTTQTALDTVLPPTHTLARRHTETSPTKQRPSHSQSPLRSSTNILTGSNSLTFADPTVELMRNRSQRSHSSAASSPLHPPARFGFRQRSSTQSSFGRYSEDVDTPPTLTASGRNSTSTTGRSSFGGLLTLSRFRQGSDPNSPRHSSPGSRSKSNSFAISREAESVVVPEREEGDTPGKYLERLEAAVSRSLIAGILSKSADPFAQAVLRSYTRRFMFFGEPIDMSLRKYLLEAELPKETQQVDRVIQAFADRYHECNPGIFKAPDQAYIVAFSIMMLHTDAFNKNNKRKMQKADYIKNTSGQGVSDEVLACMYDNICYTPFVHYEEEVDINGEKVLPFRQKKSTGKLKSAIPGADAVSKKTSGPVDPYNLLVDQKLDQLRPSLGSSIAVDDPYTYLGSSGELDIHYLQRAFTHTGVLQIISARSRPAAYESQGSEGTQDPIETQQGIVDLKITKVGILWRKAAQRRKARSPWQEWGAILTGSQLYLFKDAHWAKGLSHQFQVQQRPGRPRTPVVFRPPLHAFKPDALIKTDNAVALTDATYTRHKHAFVLVRPGGQEEVLLADNEAELNDWLGLVNYAAAFRAAGVRIRGMVGVNEEESPTRGISNQLQRQVMAARRQIMIQKISELENEFADANRQLEGMLRNARHLLVLAPIAAKTREDIMHAAARTDAMIKWLRRDIWRLKCHRDLLAMDVKLDGLSAGELEKLTSEQKSEVDASTKKEKPKLLTMLSTQKNVESRSPPRSPMSNGAGRPSTSGSLDELMDDDVFRTPPESTSPIGSEPWQLPALSLDSEPSIPHRPSITSDSTHLSVSAHPRRASLSQESSRSSIAQPVRQGSLGESAAEHTTQEGYLTPTSSVKDDEVRSMVRAPAVLATPDGRVRKLSVDAGAQQMTPESKQRSTRKSFQKTLRGEGHYHHRNSTHKHRRGKDSDSTVRSMMDDRDTTRSSIEEGTPGLARDKPRFILHGKQASVVQFGGDWERMKLRREQYYANHSNTQATAGASSSPSQDTNIAIHRPESPTQALRDAAYERRRSQHQDLLRAGAASPVIRDLVPDTSDDESAGDHNHTDLDLDDDDPISLALLREDAELAAAFANASSSPERRISAVYPAAATSPRTIADEAKAVSPNEESSYFHPSSSIGSVGSTSKRTTVIGPAGVRAGKGHSRFASLEKGEDGTVRLVGEEDQWFGSDDEGNDGQDRGKRRTVLGPGYSFAGAEEGS